MKRIFARYLFAQVLVIGFVILIFKAVGDRLTAGALAGTAFVLIGAWVVMKGIARPELRRSGSFVFACLHLFGIALPLMLTRLLNHASAFENIHVLGLPGPVFHRLSTAVYLLWILATVADLFQAWRKESTKNKGPVQGPSI